MTEYVTKEQVIDWYRPYGQTDELISFETLVSDLRDMKTADVSLVRHGQWENITGGMITLGDCSECKARQPVIGTNYCKNCGAKMDLEA